jgi:integrase
MGSRVMPADRPNNQPIQYNRSKLLEQVRQTIRWRRLSLRTEEAYPNWIERFICFHNGGNPIVMGAVLQQLDNTKWLMASLLYGSGLRLIECLRLRVKDIDFAYNLIIVREGKGSKDRVTMLLQSLKESLWQHLNEVKLLHKTDLVEGFGNVYLPYALERKYRYWAEMIRLSDRARNG